MMPIATHRSLISPALRQLASRPLSAAGFTDRPAPGQVRVRFAPSPTGHIHLGGLRTALYNYLFARQHQGGKFVLRIEDTDRARLVPGSAEHIERVLHWAGLAPDESPLQGGAHGPYEQSKRLDLYRAQAHRLVEEGKAYRCFCSPTRLELLRKFQARNRQKTRYDGKCRELSEPEIEEKLAESGCKFAIRFALREGTNSFDDLIFGTISANLVDALESDPVILKTDGFPTYHFASVVDDHHMEISHVLRGSEWISSTIKHVQLYSAFGWRAPQFAHFPLITMQDGGKMSKRNDQGHVQSWIDAGYQPETLFNFLTQSGGGVPKAKQDAMDFWTLDELVRGFDFKQVTHHPGSLDMNRLAIYSAKELKASWEKEPGRVMARFHQLLEARSIVAELSDASIRAIISQLIDRLTSLADLLSRDYVYIWRQPKLTWDRSEYASCNTQTLLEAVISVIDSNGLQDKAKFLESVKALARDHKLEYAKLLRLLRKILTNSDKGLPVHDVMQLLGSERTSQYLRNGIAYLNDNK